MNNSVPETSNNIVRKEQSLNVEQHCVGSVLANKVWINARGPFVESRTDRSDSKHTELSKADRHSVGSVLSECVFRCPVPLQYFEAQSLLNFII